jgi:chromosome segregation ATPase
VSQDEFDAPAADLTDALHAIQHSIATGNEALDHFQPLLESTIGDSKKHVEDLHSHVVAKSDQLEKKTQAITHQLAVATEEAHDIRQKCVAELNDLTHSLTSLDTNIQEFVGTCQSSLFQVTHDLDTLDGSIGTKREQTEDLLDRWLGEVPGTKDHITTAQVGYVEAITSLIGGADASYRQLAEDATRISQDSGETLQALTSSFGSSASVLSALTASGLRDALRTLQLNADEVERLLDGSIGDLVKASERINDKAGKVIDLLDKVADLLRAIKPVTDTLSAVT